MMLFRLNSHLIKQCYSIKQLDVNQGRSNKGKIEKYDTKDRKLLFSKEQSKLFEIEMKKEQIDGTGREFSNDKVVAQYSTQPSENVVEKDMQTFLIETKTFETLNNTNYGKE